MEIGIRRELDRSFEDTLTALPEALKSEGFGVLTEIDVKGTLKAKLDLDFRKYRILGACNPHLAHRALSHELNIGVMLPCNVVVYESEPGRAIVIAVDPMQTLAAQAGPEIQAVAAEVKEKLTRVLERL